MAIGQIAKLRDQLEPHTHVSKRTLKPDTIFHEVFRFGDETLYAAHRRIVGLREPEGSRHS